MAVAIQRMCWGVSSEAVRKNIDALCLPSSITKRSTGEKYVLKVCIIFRLAVQHLQVLGKEKAIEIERDTGEVTVGRPDLITDRPEEAVPGSDVIILYLRL